MIKKEWAKNIYVIGIKGSGMVGLVEILKKSGANITGSDTREKFFTDAVLKNLGIEYFEGFDKNHLHEINPSLVIYSTAYREDNNEEWAEAKKMNLMMKSYPEMLGEIFREYYGLAVCGTHGKTTTSAMLALALEVAGTDPSAVIGSQVRAWGTNARFGTGEFFVIEADEFQDKFRFYEPKSVILTSVDYDHPDFFKDFQSYKDAFERFVEKLPRSGHLVVWGDSVASLEVSKATSANVITYGFNEENEMRAINCSANGFQQSFEAYFMGQSLGRFELNVPGKHNILNALAVIALSRMLHINLEKVRESLSVFSGTARRFELVGERNGAPIIDDYGHHPEEIKATLKTLREIYPEKNITVVFHPHSYSRTEALMTDFAQSFSDADRIVILDIYGSAREYSGSVNSKDLAQAIYRYTRRSAEYIPTISEALDFLKDKIGSEDVVLTIGAGNVCDLAQALAKK